MKRINSIFEYLPTNKNQAIYSTTLCFLIFLFWNCVLFAQTTSSDCGPNIQWEKTFGGSGYDVARSIQQTSDGGYIVAGHSDSNDGDVTGNIGGDDYWVLKLNAQGNIQWKRNYGFTTSDAAMSIMQTTDGGYAIAGTSNVPTSNGGNGGNDYLVMKLNSAGAVIWQKSVGGTGTDTAYEIDQTTDGGFVIGGMSRSFGGWVEYYAIKLSSSGNLQWQKIYGSNFRDEGYTITATNDGGCIMSGHAYISNTATHFWMVKMASNGQMQWQQLYGGTNWESARSIKQTQDGGYIVAGYAMSNNGDVVGHNGYRDYWVLKLDSSGNLIWSNSLGGTAIDYAYSVQQTTDGGFIVAGKTESTNGDVTMNNGNEDFWIVKLDNSGTLLWEESFGGSLDDVAYSIDQTQDGGFIIAGSSKSIDGDVTGNQGSTDYWIVKLGAPTAISLTTNTVTPTSCSNALDGSITITTSGGTPPYTYLWSNGSTQADITGLPAGSFQVTVSDDNGCEISQSITVAAPAAIEIITSTVTPTFCNNSSDGSINITTTGGTSPYTYSWSNGSIQEDISGLSAGSYQVTVSDVNGCAFSQSITVTEPTIVKFTTSVVLHVSCKNGSDGSIATSTTGGTPPYTYLWSNGATQANLSGLSAGTYQVTASDAHGCEISQSITINEPSAINLTTSTVAPVSCNNASDGSIATTITGGTPPYTYLWSNGATQADIYNLPAGMYEVSVTDANGCTFSQSFTIAEPGIISSSVAVSHETLPAANDGAIDLTVTGGTLPYTFNWDNGATTEDLTALAPGDYCVTITDANGCQEFNCSTVDPGMSTLNEIKELMVLELFPNPAHTSATLEVGFAVPTNIHLKIINVLGQEVYSIKQDNFQADQFVFDLKDYTPGTYLVTIETEGQVAVKKMIVL